MCILTKLCPLYSWELLGSEVSWNVTRHKPLTLLYLIFNYLIINSWEHLQLENSDLGFGQVMLLLFHRNHAFKRFPELLHVKFKFHIASLQTPSYVTTPTVNVDLEGFFYVFVVAKPPNKCCIFCHHYDEKLIIFQFIFFFFKKKFMHIIMSYTTHSYRY